MNEAERSGLSTMRDCWISGGSALTVAPAEWQALVAGAAAEEHELLLLAIAGQAFDVGFRPAAPKTLTFRPALPTLGLPAVPDRHRPLFRSALKNAADALGKLRVIGLTEARGYVSHPLDWMPSASDLEAPGAYAPWVDWQAQASGKGPVLEALSADNWDDFYPAARRVALADIRRNDPAAARTLLEARAGSEPAEVRLPLIELLRVNLSPDDAPYLQSLASDRSGKVKLLAARFLARIGQNQTGTDGEAEAKELAGFIEPGRTGLIRRRTTYAPKTVKNNAQINRRTELFDLVQLIDLAKALGAAELDLVEAWQLGSKDYADADFARMVCASGSDDSVSALARNLMQADGVYALSILLPRLDAGARRDFARLVLSRGVLDDASLVRDVEAGYFEQPDMLDSVMYKQTRAAIAQRKPDDRSAPDLSLFGYLASPGAARAIIADLTAAGLGPADPSLALLRLNAALSER